MKSQRMNVFLIAGSFCLILCLQNSSTSLYVAVIHSLSLLYGIHCVGHWLSMSVKLITLKPSDLMTFLISHSVYGLIISGTA